MLETYSSSSEDWTIVRRGSRMDEYVATFKFKWNGSSSTSPGWLVRWLSPGDFLAIAITNSDSKARLYQRKDDGALTIKVTSGTTLSLSAATWYTAKVVLDTSGGSQRLRFWVDTDNDSSFADETTLLNTLVVDDDWDAGHVGLFRGKNYTAAQQYDDVKVGFDNNADGDIDDAGDDIQIDDNFNTNVITLSYDNNGNLTDDGIHTFVYDAWNRLRKAVRGDGSDETTIGEYHYYGDNRRSKKVVTNSGAEQVANDGGNTTVLFYYDSHWRIVETRNGSNQTIAQYFWGTQYTDEILCADVNGDPTESNDCDPDDQGGESTADARYFHHQDRNWNVVALSQYSETGDAYAGLVERYRYTPYGQFVVLKGDTGSGNELGNVLLTSSVGNVFAHEGLPMDQEKGSYQNRHRSYSANLARFTQRDPAGYIDGPNPYAYVTSRPLNRTDPQGLQLATDACIDGCDDEHAKTIAICTCIPWIKLISKILCKGCTHTASNSCVASCNNGGYIDPPTPTCDACDGRVDGVTDCEHAPNPYQCARCFYGCVHGDCW